MTHDCRPVVPDIVHATSQLARIPTTIGRYDNLTINYMKYPGQFRAEWLT